jgi:hypothetical protein
MAKIKNKAKYKKSDKNVNISTNEYPDNLQMSLSGGGNNRLGYLSLIFKSLSSAPDVSSYAVNIESLCISTT